MPSNATLIVTGDVTSGAVMPRLEAAFGAGRARPRAAQLPAAPQLTARQVYLVDKPGAAQSQIRIGWVGVPRSTPDYFALRVLNTDPRRLVHLAAESEPARGARLRLRRQLIVRHARASAGPFFAAAGVQTDKTAEALTEFFKELDAIRKPIPAEELEKAKNYVALLLPRNFETTESLAGSLAQMFVYNLPADYFETYTRAVRAVTPADVQRAAERYIQPDKFAVVVVGD